MYQRQVNGLWVEEKETTSIRCVYLLALRLGLRLVD